VNPASIRSLFFRSCKWGSKAIAIIVLHVVAALVGAGVVSWWYRRSETHGAAGSHDGRAPRKAIKGVQDPEGSAYSEEAAPAGSRASRWVIPLLRIVLLIVATVLVLSAIGATAGIHYLVSAFREQAALNKWIARTLALIFLAASSYGIASLFSIRARRRRRGLIVLLATMVAFNVTMYYLTQQVAFNPKTGEHTRYYTFGADGYRFFDGPGFDPKTGQARLPVTEEVIKRAKAAQHVVFAETSDDTHFFDPITGTPLAYYYRSETGAFELFNAPGYHPRFSTPLLPMTKESAREYFAWKEGRQILSDSLAAAARGTESAGRHLGEAVVSTTPPVPSPQAVAEAKRAARLNPDNIPILIHAAEVCSATGDYAGAKRYYQLVLEVDPTHAVARRKLQEMGGGQ